MDAGKPFVQATYVLEGDGLRALQCYEVMSSLTTAVNMAPMPHYSNLQAVARRLSGGSNIQAQQQLVQYAASCVQPGIQYFNDRLNGSTCCF